MILEIFRIEIYVFVHCVDFKSYHNRYLQSMRCPLYLPPMRSWVTSVWATLVVWLCSV